MEREREREIKGEIEEVREVERKRMVPECLEI